MKRWNCVGLVICASILGASGAQSQEPAIESLVTLPDGIVWETDNDYPLIGSPDAIRGGTLNYYLLSYPLTFRLMGPNANDAFAGWNRRFTFDFTLVARHPVTNNFIPVMATHWSVQDDQRTIYFRLDPDARFSDGEAVTADDYVFTWRMMQSEHIVDPSMNNVVEEYYESVDKIDDYTLRIVGTRSSWRPLYDYAELWPTPSHAVVLDDDWVDRTTNEFQIAVGPYVVSEVSRGESVTFERLDDWWGDGKRHSIGQYNVDRINLKVIQDERSLDYFRLGELDIDVENTARTWNEEYTFEAVRNGWVRRGRVFLDTPSGVYGLHMNLEAPIFQNKDFRKAMQYLFNFERLNDNLMYGEYFQLVSFFQGSEYANPDVKPYPFDPVLAQEHLERAGYRRPDEVRSGSLLGSIWNVLRGLIFTRSNTDDILVNEQGQKASFTLMYGSAGLTRHLTVMQQEFRRAGVEIKLQLLEGGTAFQRGLDRKYEMTLTNRSASFYPVPRQYLHSEGKDTTNNNNIWGFGTEEVDELIEIYERDLDLTARLEAVHRIDEIVHEEAFYIPFWDAPYTRLVYWDYVQFPEFYLPRHNSTLTITDWMVYWIDPEKKAALEEAMARGEAFPVYPELDKDFYGIRERFLP